MVLQTNAFLVCGLGSLGQFCVSVLKEFGVSVFAIEATEIKTWEIPDLRAQIDQLVIGDCARSSVLQEAHVEQCRAILIVTTDEPTNIETAFVARSLNPTLRIIVRSAQTNLNELLSHQLGNFVGFDPSQLSAPSFALAALAKETRGFFTLEDQLLQIVRVSINSQDAWCNERSLHQLNNSTRRLITHARPGVIPPQAFYQWEPNATVEAGDSIVYIELTRRTSHVQSASTQIQWQDLKRLKLKNFKPALLQLWQQTSQTQRVGIVSTLVMINLFLLGALVYKVQYSNISPIDALNVALVLAIGGYDNLFGQLQVRFLNQPVPLWIYLLSVTLTIAGTIFTGILYAILTERVLVSRFEFTRKRSIPKADHVVLIGLGRVGHRVATLLQEFKQPFVGVHPTQPEPALPSQIPVVIGDLKVALTKVNLTTAKSVLVVTDDEVLNLEIALRAQAINPSASLVIRTFKPSFQRNVAQLLPNTRVLGAYGLAAEAFVASAFGENVLNLFRLNNQTLLVTDYRISADDRLNELLLADVAYGYDVIPILHQRGLDPARFMPSDDVRLAITDRLVIIASIEGLQHIENGHLLPKSSWIQIEKTMSQESAFESAHTIARITGCDIKTARAAMGTLPTSLDIPLYDHQAQRLIRELKKVQTSARLG